MGTTFRGVLWRLLRYAVAIGIVAVIVMQVLPRFIPSLYPSQKVNLERELSTPQGEAQEQDLSLKIVTLLPFDAIPAIDRPQFLSPEDATLFMRPEELVIGLSINGESKAYPIFMLSQHEIVNDVVGGQPVAVTW